MGKKCKVYTSENISRFVDNELSPDLYHGITKHLSHCLDCSRLAQEYRTLSAVFSDHAHQGVLKIDPAGLKQKLAQAFQTPQTQEKKSIGNVFGFFGKNTYLKLASIAAILMISLLAFQVGQPQGPSAIVKSVETDFASVMILETQKEKHTIIWFSET